MEEDADAPILTRLDDADGPCLSMVHDLEQLSGGGFSEGHNILRRDALCPEGMTPSLFIFCVATRCVPKV